MDVVPNPPDLDVVLQPPPEPVRILFAQREVKFSRPGYLVPKHVVVGPLGASSASDVGDGDSR